MTITPELVASILAAPAHRCYINQHHRNAEVHAVRKCKPGTVFVNQEGEYCVYLGIGSSRKRPIVYLRLSDRALRNSTLVILTKIAKATEQDK